MNDLPCDRCTETCLDGAGFYVEPDESDYWAGTVLCESCFIEVVEGE